MSARWTAEVDNELRDAWPIGKAWKDMTKAEKRRIRERLKPFGHTTSACTKRATALGINVTTDGGLESALRVYAADVEVSTVACIEHIAGMRTAFSDEQKEDLDRFARGYAGSVHHSIQTVRMEAREWLEEKGIRPRNEARRTFAVWTPPRTNEEVI